MYIYVDVRIEARYLERGLREGKNVCLRERNGKSNNTLDRKVTEGTVGGR